MYSLEDYNYTLPDELIAQTPASPADSCKLLVYDKKGNSIKDHIFHKLPTLLSPDTLLVFNNSKVVKARIPLKDLQGEIFYLTSHGTHTFEALVRPGKKFKVGKTIELPGTDINFQVKEITEDGRLLTCSHPILEVLEKHGQMPLPPYISYDEAKEDDYQPIVAENTGSVAAPTASLHFTEKTLKQLKKKGIETTTCTLHVGLGTFKQVDVENITEYQIHSEILEIDIQLFQQLAHAKLESKNILAIGTTVTRTLETLPYLYRLLDTKILRFLDEQTIAFWDTLTKDISLVQAQSFASNITILESKVCFLESTLFIYPGFQFRIIDQLLTNFHLPKSSLLMLVAGFIGYDEMKRLYDHAIAEQYRFYSFGDCMLTI